MLGEARYVHVDGVALLRTDDVDRRLGGMGLWGVSGGGVGWGGDAR